MYKIITLIVALLLVTHANAQEFTLEEFEKQLDKSVSENAYTKIKELLNHPLVTESAYANRIYGFAYLYGDYGFNPDKAHAMQYLEIAHELGDINSTYTLGMTYIVDPSSPIYNAPRGFELLAISAEDGYPVAQALSAICYLDRDCANQAAPQNMKDWFTEEQDVFAQQALETLKVATQLPNAKDKFKDVINVMLNYSSVLQEEDIEPDYSYIPTWFARDFGPEQVELWLEVGALEGHEVATITLAAMCYLEVGSCSSQERALSLLTTVKDNNPAIISEGTFREVVIDKESDYTSILEALGFHMIGALDGDVTDMLELKYIFVNGAEPLDIKAGDPRAEEWNKKLMSASAEDLYNAYRSRSLVISTHESKGQSAGNFLTPTLTLAKQADIFFELALEKRFPEALVTKAIEHLQNNDYSSALPLLEEAANKKHPHANFLLSVMFHEGLSVEKDANKSFKYAERAAKLGHARAQYTTARKYLTGDGTIQDYYLAFSWANQASTKLEDAMELRTKLEEVFSEKQLHQARMVSSDLRMSLDKG